MRYASNNYRRSVVLSVRAFEEKHGDNIHIVVTVYDPGIHLLAKNPQREVPPDVLERNGQGFGALAADGCGEQLSG